jgi:hypothetical protein
VRSRVRRLLLHSSHSRRTPALSLSTVNGAHSPLICRACHKQLKSQAARCPPSHPHLPRPCRALTLIWSGGGGEGKRVRVWVCPGARWLVCAWCSHLVPVALALSPYTPWRPRTPYKIAIALRFGPSNSSSVCKAEHTLPTLPPRPGGGRGGREKRETKRKTRGATLFNKGERHGGSE